MNESLLRSTLFAHLAATLYMVGVIWMVQLVHYPLYNKVGREAFPEYETRHNDGMTLVVGPAMLVEAATVVLLALLPSSRVPAGSAWLGAGLLAIIWLSTAFLQVPCHNRLVSGFDQATYERLVNTNWIRTIAWSLRGVLALWMVWRQQPPAA
jgi:uncharacterized membrane protein